MGFTFIALQDFDLIAAVADEVRGLKRTVPCAMYLSLGIALAIYPPFLLLLATVGAPGPGGIGPVAARNSEGLVAEAAEQFLEASGYWLVIGAGVLSMLSALRANLVAAARVAFSMARDHTLPRSLGRIHASTGTPAAAVAVTGVLLTAISLAVSNVAAAGAASSVILLNSFAMVHWTSILARRRSGGRGLSWFPLAGAVLCLGLAVFQALAVPSAGEHRTPPARSRRGPLSDPLRSGRAARRRQGGSTGPGARAAPRAESARSRSDRQPGQRRKPRRCRGHTPHPRCRPHPAPLDHPTRSGPLRRGPWRSPRHWEGPGRVPPSLDRSLLTETLLTIAPDVWREIARVTRLHNCETVLLGFPGANDPGIGARLDGLIAGLEADVVVLHAPRRWQITGARRILVPVAGGAHHSRLRTRITASLSRSGKRSLTFLRIVPGGATPDTRWRVEQDPRTLAANEATGECEVVVDEADRPIDGIVRHASNADLIILGMYHSDRTARTLGGLLLELYRHTDVPIVAIGESPRRGPGIGPWRLPG